MSHWARIILLAALVVPCMARAQTAPLVITGVTVINSDGPARTGMTVVIDDGRIVAIADARTIKTPNNARVVDGAGKFLIPGLWDMHVHLAWKGYPQGAYLPALVAKGVTGVRDMGAPPELIAQRRKDIAEGKLLGPRIIAVGPILQGPQIFNVATGTFCLPSMCDVVTNAAEAREAVQSVKRAGGQFVKVHDWLSREVYLAIVTEARREGLQVVGHLPIAVRAEEAAEAGQKSIEHLGSVLGGLLMASSSREEELRTEYLELGKKPGGAAFLHAFDAATIAKMLDNYDPGRAAALFEKLKKNSVWQCPTLVLHEANAKGNPRSTPEDKEQLARLFQKQLAFTNAMREAGLEFLAGTDFVPGPNTTLRLHDELSLLVRSGFTPQEALKTATINPARYLGLADRLGTVEQGKIADLVLLEANPLESIGNTSKISAVVVDGRLFLKHELDLMVAGAAK